jgi:Ni/Fe-hydrogenase subunit HybB-like protein
MTRPYKVLLGVAGLGAAMVLWRFAAGLGAVANINDGYPWGLWISFDVVIGTAFGCGGYAVALLVYILNKGEYHPVVRPAILTSLLGYGLAVLAVAIDLGRPWELWKVPLFFWRWTGSPQLEVALCVAAYVTVLLVEMSPAFFEKWRTSRQAILRTVSEKALRLLDRAALWIIALGILLPTMHQSSLGTMMLLPGPKLHPLWFTPWIPLLFLVNCIIMGYAIVVLESTFSARAFRRPYETKMLASLSQVALWVTVGWLVFRVGEVALSGELGLVASPMGVVFLAELAIHLGAVAILASAVRRSQPAHQFRAAMLLVLAGMAFRFDTYLIAFNPGEQWSYFPAIPEFLITTGIVALEIAIYVAVVKKFPVLAGAPHGARA